MLVKKIMGSLKPETTYIYERVGGVTYARETGAHPNTRVAIGWDYTVPNEEFRKFASQLADEVLWQSIMKEAETNHTLHEAIERVKILYYLSKDNGDSKT